MFDENGFKLHSKGENWWHFRKDLDSIMQSFTISLIHDGTVVLSGDYGVLAIRREYFPKDMKQLYGFPNIDTGICYFAEKVVKHISPPEIKDYNEDRAKKEVEEILKETYGYDEDGQESKLEEVMDSLNFLTYDLLLDSLMTYDPSGDWYEYNLGMDYTDNFKFQFDLFRFWGNYVLSN